MSEARIEALETALAYQDETIAELREALAVHYREIDALKREVHNLTAQLRQVEAHPALSEGPEPPPPHY